MKRTVLSLLLALCLSLAACAGTASAPPSESATAPDPSSAASAPTNHTPAATTPADPTVYSYRTLPGVPLPEAEIRRVDVASRAVGGSDGVIDPDDLREVLSLLEQIPIYNQPADPNAVQRLDENGDTWRYDFYASPEGGTPAFSLTIHPCRIQIGEETYGPYVTGDLDGEDSLPLRISSIAHPTVPKEYRRTIAGILGHSLPEGELIIHTIAGPRGDEAFTPAPETAAAIRRTLADTEYFTFSGVDREALSARCLYRLELADPGAEPVILWVGEGSIIPEQPDYPEYRAYGKQSNKPLLALLSEAAGLDTPFPLSLSFLQSQAVELYLLRFETDRPDSIETQRAFLSWWFDGSSDLAQYAAQGEVRFPLKELRDVARWRLGVEDFDPLTVFADRLDQPGRWTWYDTANQEYVVETPGGYGGAAAIEPLERELTRNEAGELVSLRLLMGACDPNLYYQDPPEHRLIGRYEVCYDFPGGASEDWRLVSARREEVPSP